LLTYHDLLASTAIRVNALVGTDPVELQITYSTRPLTDELFDSSIFSFNAIRDAIIQVEGRLANTIARSNDHSLRAYLASFTNPLATGAVLPSLDINGTPIIGNFGACVDASDNTLMLTRKPVPYVQTILRSPLNYLISLYHYALDTNRVIHTSALILLECCVYSASAQTEAFDANLPILLPDSLAEAYINGAMALLVRDDEFTAQASQYANYFGTTLAAIPAATGEEQAA
jgi:hypothetical protein